MADFHRRHWQLDYLRDSLNHLVEHTACIFWKNYSFQFNADGYGPYFMSKLSEISFNDSRSELKCQEFLWN